MARTVIHDDNIVGTDEPMASINVTSLVDVMFCLLIMFMVATPLMSPDGVDVEIPAARGKEIGEDEFNYGVISIDAKGRVFLGTLPLSEDPARLQQELAANVKLKEDGMAFIQGDQTVVYERIVDVLVALQGAEISKVGFVTDPNLKRIQEARQ